MGFIINPYAFGAAFTGLLDTYSGAAAAYSVRKLRSAYSGNCIRVRRSNDNTEQNIGFDSNGNLNESALTTFVGGNDGFVTTWYDQSGNGNNAVQSTAANQPKIVSSGVVEKDNGKPKLIFNGNSLFDCGDVLTVGSNNLITFVVARDTSAGGGVFYSRAYPDGRPARYALLNNSDGSFIVNSTGSNISVTTTLDNNKKLWNQEFIANTSHKFYKNNSLIGSFAGSVGEIGIGPVSLPFVIGAYGPTYFSRQTGFQQELIVYLSNQSSNRTGIESNINTYYSIY